MDTLKELADAIVMLIRTGVVLRVVFCLVKMGGDEDQAPMYKKRIKNAVVFYILAESAWQLKDMIVGYYS